MAFGYLGSVKYWYGNWQESIDSCSMCIEISKKLDNFMPVSWASLFKGAAIFNSGSQDKGLKFIRGAIQIAARTDSVLAMPFFYSLFAECLAIHGDHSEAVSVNQKAQSFTRTGQKWGEIISCRTMAILAATDSRQDWRQVDSHMMRSINLAEEKKALPELVISLLRYADLFERKGDKDPAESYWNQARDLANKIGCQIFNRLGSEADI
jgi:tetratricopeptide (TPR) repeat protein